MSVHTRTMGVRSWELRTPISSANYARLHALCAQTGTSVRDAIEAALDRYLLDLALQEHAAREE